MPPITGDWDRALRPEYKKEYYKRLYERVSEEYRRGPVFPPADEVFTAFHLTPLNEVKAVILGQDPYHGQGQAHGLSFSVKPGVEPPPSLVNIYKELHEDLGIDIPSGGYLEKWARQGVLMLNTVLTVRAHQPNSHRGLGWEEFTDACIRILDDQDRPMVFFLWGAPAGKKADLLNNPRHLVLKAPHPSPLSAYRGFFGCRHFSRANDFLRENGVSPIDWRL